MIHVPAATPSTSGKTKGHVTTYEWPTSIKPEDNATGLPINKAGKVVVNVSGDAFTVAQFESHAEFQSAAGEHYETCVLDLINDKLHAAQLQRARSGFGKLAVAPLDVLAYVVERISTFDVASLWTPTEKAEKGTKQTRGVRAELANLTLAAESMSKEDLLAAIMALSAKTK